MTKVIHPVDGLLATLTIATFWLSTALSELCHEDVETSCCVTDEGRPFGAAL